MNNKGERQPIDPRPLARTVRTVLIVYLVGEAFMGLVSLAEIGRLGGGGAEAPGTVVAGGFIGLAYLAIYVVTAILTLKWIYRVNLNAKLLAPDKATGPGWAVGWYFIPFASLVMPYRAMSEAWRISLSPADWRNLSTPGLLPLWWGLFLLTNFLSMAGARIGLLMESPGALALGEMLTLASSLTAVPLVLVLRKVVSGVTEAQAQALNLRPAGGAARLVEA
ncbi:DUF4328 domain-containing protein [Phenylobacterium sp.]|uniref:DUF4328 domain-containing protein n=1 Tax=Phenylobacterium sp. TaxID=1871053 RepID=UPI0035B2F659